jgi:hypothetical protein
LNFWSEEMKMSETEHEKPPIIERHRPYVEHCRKVIGRQAATHFHASSEHGKR